MSTAAIRKMKQKVRNRKSAQRSRMRKTIQYKMIETTNSDLNKELKIMNKINLNQQEKILCLQKENNILQKKISSFESSGCVKWYFAKLF